MIAYVVNRIKKRKKAKEIFVGLGEGGKENNFAFMGKSV